jgi:hypothetical protein
MYSVISVLELFVISSSHATRVEIQPFGNHLPNEFSGEFSSDKSTVSTDEAEGDVLLYSLVKVFHTLLASLV